MDFKGFLVIVCLSLVFHPFAQARGAPPSCSNVPDIPIGPIRNQGTSDLCFINAAADLMSHHFGASVSTVGTLLNYNLVFSQNPDQPPLSDLIRASRHSTYPLTSNAEFMTRIRSQFLNGQLSDGRGGSLDGALMATLVSQVCLGSHRQDEISLAGGNDNQIMRALRGVTTVGRNTETADCEIFRKYATQLNSLGSRILDAIQRHESSQDRFIVLRNELCNHDALSVQQSRSALPLLEKVRRGNPNQSGSRDEDFSNVVNFIDQTLNMNRPVGFVYSHAEIRNTTRQQLEQKRPSNSPPPDHAAVIVGREWNPRSRRCEYKVRGSWGLNVCNQRELSPRANRRCDNHGYYFLTREELIRVTHEAVRINPASSSRHRTSGI